MTPLDASTTGMLPHKTLECEFKAIGEDGTFTLYAACFGNLDRQGDIIEAGAFDNLDEFTRDGWIALNHDQQSLPIGYPTAAVQDDKGLRIEGQFHSTPEAQAVRTVARERLRAGKAVKTSIGYVTRDESFEKSNGRMARRIKRLSVYEASFVNLPANSQAEVVDAKAEGSGATLNQAGVAHARSCIKAGKVSTGSWGFSGADGNALLGESGDDWKTYGRCHLATVPNTDEDQKGHWKYPFAKKSGGEIKLYTAALRAIASRASQQGKSAISEAASKLLKSAQGEDDVEDGDDEKSIGTLRDALNELLGLDTKAAGVTLPKSAHTRLKAFAEAMDEHGRKTRDFAKAFGEHGKACQVMGKGMKEALKAFNGDEDEDESPEDDDDESQEEEVVEDRPRKKPARARGGKQDEEPEENENPRKRSREDDAKGVYLEQLKHRSMMGRRSSPCP
jgi:HK97 family phage prohead protease